MGKHKTTKISRSGMYYQKQNKTKMDKDISNIVSQTFHKYNGIFGRDRISALTGINY